MELNPSNSINLEQLALKGLITTVCTVNGEQAAVSHNKHDDGKPRRLHVLRLCRQRKHQHRLLKETDIQAGRF